MEEGDGRRREEKRRREREEGEPPVSHTAEQDVVVCVIFALQRQYQVDTVTTPLYKLVTVDRQME